MSDPTENPDDAQGVLNPDAERPAPSATRRDVARARMMSLKGVADALDRDRNTISKWLEQGCPAVDRADRATGTPWVLDLAAVVRWLETRAAESVAERMGGGPDGTISEAEAKRRRAVAQAIIAEAEAAELLGTLARWSIMTERQAQDYGEVRARLSAIGDAVAGKLERKVAGRVKAIVDEQVRNALTSLRSAKAE